MTAVDQSLTRTPVDAVLLDVGGVLMGPDPAVVAGLLRDAAGAVSAPVIRRAHYAGGAAFDRDPAGDRAWGAYFAAFARACGVPEGRVTDTVAVLRSGFPPWDTPLPGAVDGLRALAALDVPLVIVSNASGRVEQELAAAGLCQAGPGRGVRVRRVLDSHVVGVRKPDTAIFELALDAAGVGAADALMVGDLVHADVRGAEAAGIRVAHLDPYGDCVDRHTGADVRSLADVVDLVQASRA